MYKVINRNGSVFGTEPCSCEFICDTTDDVSTLPTSIAEGTGGKTKYDNQICGSGSIAVVVDNDTNPKRYILDNQNVWCPQPAEGGRGSAQDLSGYAKKTDIPTELPANGGNADTVGGKSADDFAQIIELGWNETDTKTAVGKPTKTTIYHCGNWTDFPAESPDGQGILISANYNGTGMAGTDQMWVVQFFISARTGVTYKRYINDTGVNNWEDCRDGGNANSVGGFTANLLLKNTANNNLLTTSIDTAYVVGTYAIEPSFTPDFPTGYGTYGFLDVRAYGSICYQTVRFENGVIINRTAIVGQSGWAPWKEISTTPIKSTDISGTTDQYGNLLLWKVTDARKPILVTMNGFYAIPFLTADSVYYYVGLINCATHEYIPNTPVSGTIYYIDG